VTGLAVRLRGVAHEYVSADSRVQALRGVDLDVPAGAWHVLVGPSGSGKSTVLHLLAGLVRPTRGEVHVGPDALHLLPERRLRALRAGPVAVLLQAAGQTLLPWASARQNVELVRRTCAVRDPERAGPLLDRLGLTGVADRPVARLSGGEQQRVALAAALVTRPGLLLVDEPTSQLDRGRRDAVLALLHAARAASGATVVLTTHDPAAAVGADAVWRVADGLLSPGTLA
jgi:putative ABC transport system ATP-binding protein